MKRRELLKYSLGTAGVASLSPVAAQSVHSASESLPTTPRAGLLIEPARRVRLRGFDYDHEIRVALPRSYGATDATYPVLWVTDGSVFFEMAASIVNMLGGIHCPEVIVVSIGAPVDESMAEFARQRMHDFLPAAATFDDSSLESKIIQQHLASRLDPLKAGGGAGRFLNYLVDDLRDELSKEYRMSKDHCLFGFSFGGTFVGYSIFARPEGFNKYICGSPALWACDKVIYTMEEQYARDHDDLNIKIFFGAGDAEIGQPIYAAYPLVGSMVRLSERLTIRRYPSLHIVNKIFPDETHATAATQILNWGMRILWKGEFSPSVDMDRYFDELLLKIDA